VPKSNLSRDEAAGRARLIVDPEYQVHLDLLGEDSFGTVSRVRFQCTEPGARTFLDFAAANPRSVELNGSVVPPEAYDGTRIHLEGLAERNEVLVEADGSYTKSGKGLNRFRDPVDGNVYVHTDFEPFDAHRTFACFDQPDLKGTFRFSATVPEGWSVFSNTRPDGDPSGGDGRATWRFRPTQVLPTYLTALVAGPFHSARERHRDIDLGIHCRRSLAEHLEPEEWLEITRQGFDFFEQAFGYRYAFDKYDQVVVPEYAAGAMENAGCVTFNEHYVFRSRVTETMREMRAETILHEMAHMWFGDLVTMRWWNDLWLNESFATYASVLAQVEATRFPQGWTTFANREKIWALQQDQLPTTHPIVAEIPDVQSVHLNFDGITYAKGASVLRQLVAWVGLEPFLEGMRGYFAGHEFGNTELADFLSTLERTSGRDLHAWSKEWLETPGVNTLRPEVTVKDGAYDTFAVRQEAPEDWPALRPHRLAIGLYDVDGGRLIRRRQVELDVMGERTEVVDLAGEPVPELALLNDGDLTFAKIRFDDRSLTTVVERLGDMEDPLARSLCWAGCWDMVRDAEFPARRYLDLALRHAGRETEIGLMERALAQSSSAIRMYGDPANRAPATDRLAAGTLEALGQAQPGSDHQLAWARAFVSAARTQDHLDAVRGLLDGSVAFEGLSVDTDLRWHVVGSLAAAGVADAPELIAAELERDPTDKGQRHAASARAARPEARAKDEAWTTLLEDRTLTLAVLDSVMRGFQQPSQEDLLEPYAGRYFEALRGVWDERDLEFALDFGGLMYPAWIVSERTIELTDAHLGAGDVPSPIRRLLLEGKDGIRRALRAREADARAASRA
jgi:aminopeptidase N